MEYKVSNNFFLNFTLALVAFFPILPNAGQSIVFGLFLVVSLSYNFFLKKTVKHNFADFLFLMSTIAYYFFALFTFSYSSTILYFLYIPRATLSKTSVIMNVTSQL